MLEHRPHYRTCIVRVWREGSETASGETWRLTLEVPALGLRKGFSSFQELAETMWLHLSAEEEDRPTAPETPDL